MAGTNGTKIKVCGLTRLAEAEYIIKAGVDFAGFVLFYPKSKRNVELGKAQKIIGKIKETAPWIKTVAVTVSPTKEQVAAIQNMDFDYIQIHGCLSDEVKDTIKIPVLRAYNIENTVITNEILLDDKIAGVVFDGMIPGNGETFDWTLLKNFDRRDKMLMLAGGLTADNVKRAVMEVSPDIVDVSSWVEYEGEFRGKDPEKINAFAVAVRNAV